MLIIKIPTFTESVYRNLISKLTLALIICCVHMEFLMLYRCAMIYAHDNILICASLCVKVQDVWHMIDSMKHGSVEPAVHKDM
jgi:hypothetical protein